MAFADFGKFEFSYEPYPIAVAPNFIEPAFYSRMVNDFPSIGLFGTFPDGKSHKKALSELYRPAEYHAFIRKTPVYLEFYQYIKSPAFVRDVLDCFEKNYVQLHLHNEKIVTSRLALSGPFFHTLAKVRKRLRFKKGLNTRFEFSALPSDGGSIRPHTDAPQKIITLVSSILKPGAWNPAWKGSTDILRPKDARKSYNFCNNYLEFDECDTLRTIDYVPNQCILFLKTFNSLHCVAPIQNHGGSIYRTTVTINIEWA